MSTTRFPLKPFPIKTDATLEQEFKANSASSTPVVPITDLATPGGKGFKRALPGNGLSALTIGVPAGQSSQTSPGNSTAIMAQNAINRNFPTQTQTQVQSQAQRSQPSPPALAAVAVTAAATTTTAVTGSTALLPAVQQGVGQQGPSQSNIQGMGSAVVNPQTAQAHNLMQAAALAQANSCANGNGAASSMLKSTQLLSPTPPKPNSSVNGTTAAAAAAAAAATSVMKPGAASLMSGVPQLPGAQNGASSRATATMIAKSLYGRPAPSSGTTTSTTSTITTGEHPTPQPIDASASMLAAIKEDNGTPLEPPGPQTPTLPNLLALQVASPDVAAAANNSMAFPTQSKLANISIAPPSVPQGQPKRTMPQPSAILVPQAMPGAGASGQLTPSYSAQMGLPSGGSPSGTATGNFKMMLATAAPGAANRSANSWVSANYGSALTPHGSNNTILSFQGLGDTPQPSSAGGTPVPVPNMSTGLPQPSRLSAAAIGNYPLQATLAGLNNSLTTLGPGNPSRVSDFSQGHRKSDATGVSSIQTHSLFTPGMQPPTRGWRDVKAVGIATPSVFSHTLPVRGSEQGEGGYFDASSSSAMNGVYDGDAPDQPRTKRVRQSADAFGVPSVSREGQDQEGDEYEGEGTRYAGGAQPEADHEHTPRSAYPSHATTPSSSPRGEGAFVQTGFQNARQSNQIVPQVLNNQRREVPGVATFTPSYPNASVQGVSLSPVSAIPAITPSIIMPNTQHATMPAPATNSSESSTPNAVSCPYDKFEVSDVILRVKDILHRDQLRQKQLAKQLGFSGSTLSPMLKHKYRHTKSSHIQALRVWAYERDVQFVNGILTQAQFLGLTQESFAAGLGVPVSEVMSWSNFTMSPQKRGDFETSIVSLFSKLSANRLRGESLPASEFGPPRRMTPRSERDTASDDSEDSGSEEEGEDEGKFAHASDANEPPKQVSGSNVSFSSVSSAAFNHSPAIDQSGAGFSLNNAGDQHPAANGVIDSAAALGADSSHLSKDALIQATFPDTWDLVQSTFPSISPVLLPMVTSSLGDLYKYGYRRKSNQ